MKSIFGDSSKKSSNSSVFSWQNKQNLYETFKDEKDICKILSHFQKLIQSNNQAISDLRNEFTSRATNGSLSKVSITQTLNEDEQISYCHVPDNSMNQTYQTISKNFQTNSHSMSSINSASTLNQKLEQIQNQIREMKISETENSFIMEKRLSEKGDKNEIEKTLNLSRLLVVEINQIQDRFKENEKITKVQEDKIKFLQQTFHKMDQKLFSETQILSKKIKQHNQVQDLMSENSVQNETLIKNFQIKLEQMQKLNQENTKNIMRKMSEQYNQKFQEQLNGIYSRIVNIESQEEENLCQNQSLSNEIKLELHNMTQENKKVSQKIKKDTELQLSKKFDSLDKLYIKKSFFLKQKQDHESQIQKKITQSIGKIQYNLTARIQKMQKSHQSLQITLQNINNILLTKINKVSEEYSDKLTQIRQQIQKRCSKYSKEQTVKQLIESQNQKVHQIINTNLQEQKRVNSVLCSQNILGRWLWQNQELKNGNLISWDKQVINTLPQNFRFSQEKQNSAIIEISSGGIYKFQLGFYSKKKPTIQVLINGKVIISAVNSSSYVIHHSSGKLKAIEPNEVAGLTLVDFFLVPQNSRIAIAYNGDVRGEGFLNIHRL